MRKLVALGVLVLLLVAVDQAARLYAENQLEARAKEAGGGSEAAVASIRSFPFLGRLLASGSVPEASVRVTGTQVGPLRLAAVEVEASGVELDRDAMLVGDVRLDGIDRGRVSVELDAAALTGALGLPVTIADEAVQVVRAGVRVRATVALDEGSLVVRVAGLPALRVPVGDTPLVPCAATAVSITDGRVRLTCELDELPAVLKR